MNSTIFIQKLITLAEEYPKKCAIVSEDGEITYSQLIYESKNVANLLNENKAPNWVYVNANEGIKSYVYIVGVWMSGRGYIPVDLELPNERLMSIFYFEKDSFFLSGKEFKNVKSISKFPDQNHNLNNIKSATNAYLIFTSGTTGIPKPIQISWKNLGSFLEHYLKFDFKDSDRFLQTYDLTFDVSVFIFSTSLMFGAELHLLPSKGVKYLNVLNSLATKKITVVSMVPSVIHLASKYLDELNLPSLRYSFFSGDALRTHSAKLWMRSVPNAKVYNCYGPTETTIVCTEENLNDLPKEYFNQAVLPLGDVFENHFLEINEDEIVIAGPQVVLREHYPESFVEINGRWFYKTGDLGEFDVNRKLIFKGRKDDQVQVNGYRVELLEVENVISKIIDLPVQVVHHTTDLQGSFLVAFVEAGSIGIDENSIMSLIQGHLPNYSLPKNILVINKFPLNRNGKVDKNELTKIISSSNK